MKVCPTATPAIPSHPDARPEKISIKMSKMNVGLAMCMKTLKHATQYPVANAAFYEDEPMAR
jgi:hypothetical protein